MISFLGAVLLVGSMLALLQVFGLFSRARQAVRLSRSALHVINDPAVGDDRKEALLQGYSLSLLRSFVDLLLRSAVSITIPIGLLWALEFTGVLSLKAVLALTLSWPFLLGGVIAALMTCWFLEK